MLFEKSNNYFITQNYLKKPKEQNKRNFLSSLKLTQSNFFNETVKRKPNYNCKSQINITPVQQPISFENQMKKLRFQTPQQKLSQQIGDITQVSQKESFNIKPVKKKNQKFTLFQNDQCQYFDFKLNQKTKIHKKSYDIKKFMQNYEYNLNLNSNMNKQINDYNAYNQFKYKQKFDKKSRESTIRYLVNEDKEESQMIWYLE